MDKLLNWLNFFETDTPLLKHYFGRGINASPVKNEEELYNNSYNAFEKKEILDAYEYFFKSLENFSHNSSNNNIKITRNHTKLEFKIYQGTAKIVGNITQEHLYAEVILIKQEHAHVALKRYILERNYQLTYSNYSADDNYIKLKLFHNNITMNPQKIFYPIRELALNSDFDKEFMRSEFPDIKLQDIEHIEKLDEDEVKIKYSFLKKWIEDIENKIATLPSNDNAGMQSFICLNILFKIDYLIVPKYEIYQNISKKVQSYFNDETVSTEAKNDELRRYIDKLKNMSFEEFRKNFYNSRYTFDPSEITPQEEITTFINESLMKIRWYKNNRYNQIIPTLYRYISFYILYNYNVNPVLKSLLHTLVEIYNPEYFEALGYQTLYDKENELFSKKVIISKLEDAVTLYQKRFKSLKPFGNKLNFSSLNEFSNSFYLQLNDLNFEEI